jgi:hypothetical protein
LRFFLSLRNVEEMMAERLMVAHTTVWRWCQSYGPMIYQRLRGKLKYTTTTWHMDETYVRIAAGGCICSVPWTATAALSISICRKREIVRRPKRFCRRLYRIRTTELHTCCACTSAEHTLQRFEICKPKDVSRSGVDDGPNDMLTTELNRITDMSNKDSVSCRAPGP